MLIAPRPDFLATVDERLALLELDKLQKGLPANADAKTRARIARLQGVITWDIDTEYQDRFSKANAHLHELDADVERLHKIYHSFVRTRQAATQSYKGYDAELTQLRIKMRQAADTIKQLMARQGHMIEVMAINELELRRKRLEQYQVKARFAMAESYDRATKAQQDQVKQTVEKSEKAEKAEKSEPAEKTGTAEKSHSSDKADK